MGGKRKLIPTTTSYQSLFKNQFPIIGLNQYPTAIEPIDMKYVENICCQSRESFWIIWYRSVVLRQLFVVPAKETLTVLRGITGR